MKYRSRKYKKVAEEPSYWPSFVDIMTTMSLVFLFIMLIYSGMNKMFVDNIVNDRVKLYKEIKSLLEENNVDEDVMVFDEDKGKIIINSNTFFSKNDSKLTNDGKKTAKELRKILYKLLSDKNIEEKIKYIEVVGHTDYIGTTVENRKLSTDRARSFLDYIVPLNSKMETKYGAKFKASGMSEFETNKTKKQRDRESYENEKEAAKQRKIEVKIQFNESDIDQAVVERMKSMKDK